MNRCNLLPILLIMPLTLAAEDHIQLQAHVHGVTELEIAKEADELELSLISPAYNLVGFESKPSTEIQMRQVTDVMTLLKSPERFLGLNNQAGCKTVSIEVETSLIETSEGDTGAKHRSDGDTAHENQEPAYEHEHHAHEHEGEAHDHADFHAHYHYRCEDPDSLSTLEIDLFSHFPLIDEIHAQIITRNMQHEMKLTPGKTRIPLTP